MNKLAEEIKITEILSAGIKLVIRKSIINQYKDKIRDGHISDTMFDKYTNPIPKKILKKKQALDKLKVFDDFVIYHVWNEEAEKKKEEQEEVSPQEKADMKDPILFGVCKDIPDKLFYNFYELPYKKTKM